MNYVGILQEKCQKAHIATPEYEEHEAMPDKTFKCICSCQKLTTEGIGLSKKAAKQHAAELMVNKAETEQIFNQINNRPNDEAGCILNWYCQHKQLEYPRFSEQPKDNNLFVIECSFGDYKCFGKGITKKIAKKMSLNNVIEHFNIHKFYEEHKTKDDKLMENSITKLSQLCHKRKYNISFEEEQFNDVEGLPLFVTRCTVGKHTYKTKAHISERLARVEASSVMLDLLNADTPVSSPRSPTEEPTASDEVNLTPKKQRLD